ncbi:tetratricopeptide repeat protein [Streptomyces sp. PA03-1a]|nr:tetratricopeptide repeat protein [Streptomyces sp. PA03-1a]
MLAQYGGVAVGHAASVIVGGRASVSWPWRVGAVPGQAESFQHRGVADVLDDAVADDMTTPLCLVLAGTGGVGKTQLAAAHARAAWQAGTVDLLAWVTAGSRDAVVAAYAQAGAEVAGADPDDPQQAAGRFITWLETTDRRWLVVLDDVADPADLRGLWPPVGSRGHGRVLVTTRRRDAALTGEGRRLIHVGLFTPGEAGAYLTAKLAAHQRTDHPGQIANLAADLGFLPLALAQAAAYLTDRDLDCATYRDRLADRRRTLPDLAPDESGLPDDHRTVLAATWSLSTEQADRLRPAGLARPMLELASMLDPNGIPQTVLTSPPTCAYLTRYRTASGVTSGIGGTSPETGRQVDTGDAADALRCLSRLSLAELDPVAAHRAVRVHSLIQRAARESLSKARRGPLARAAADALLAAWPEIERDIDLAQALRSSAATLARRTSDELWQPTVHEIIFRAGDSLGEAGLAADAVAYFRHAVDQAARMLGPDHPSTLRARYALGRSRGESGDFAGAADSQRELLADRLRVLGPDHPDTLGTRASLAFWRGHGGDPAGAAADTHAVIADMVRVLGPGHTSTLSARHNLADWQGKSGDPAGAAEAYAELLTDSLRVLGPDHFDTLDTRRNLAYWRGRAGAAAEAAAALELVAADYSRVLGPHHPDTMHARDDLADWRGRAGDPVGAVAAYAELLGDRLRVLGPDHPHTLTNRHNLAEWRGLAGDAAAAAADFQELLADQTRILGAEHPHTLSTRHDLAGWQGEAHGATAALEVLEALAVDRLHILGPAHPDTLATRHNLAYWRGRAGDAPAAVAGLRQLLDDQVPILGPDHPSTLAVRHNLAYWQAQAGDTTGATAAFRELLDHQLRILGPNHPDTLETRQDLAEQRAKSGDVTGAIADFRQLLADQQRVLRPGHPHILAARAHLAELSSQ